MESRMFGFSWWTNKTVPATRTPPGPESSATDWQAWINTVLRQARKAVVLVIGGTFILFGVAMLVLPGPGILTIALGLAVLATEFVWARRWLKRLREKSAEVAQSFLGGEAPKAR
jgi:uncharacterized protein (TIGR02611 family)